MVGSYIDIYIYIYIGSDWFRHLVRFVEFIPVDQKVTCGSGGILAVPKGGSSLGIVKAPGIDVSKGNNGNYRTQETHGNSILSWYSVRWFPEDFPFNYSNDLLKVCCCICWLGQSRVRGLNAETRGVARQALHCIKFQEALLPDDLMWIRDHFESLVEVNSSHSSENIWNVLFNISESMGNPKNDHGMFMVYQHLPHFQNIWKPPSFWPPWDHVARTIEVPECWEVLRSPLGSEGGMNWSDESHNLGWRIMG